MVSLSKIFSNKNQKTKHKNSVMKKVVLNTNEAVILNSFEKDSIQSVPEITVHAKLTPSQVREGIEGLNQKKFLRKTKNYNVFKITPSGSSAMRNLMHHSKNVLVID